VVAYRVTFPGPVGKVNAGIAATLVHAEADPEEIPVEGQIAEQVARYLRGIKVSAARLHCDVVLLGNSGSGSVWSCGDQGRRIGTFQLERLDQDAEPAR
jgi:hypothetical protein